MLKIIFVLSFGSLGGIEKSLLNLLHNFDFSKYSVDIGLINKRGELLKYMPKEANIIDIDCFRGECWELINDSPHKNLKRLGTKFRFTTAFLFLLFYLINKCTDNKYLSKYYKWLTRKEQKLSTCYDVAIAYGGPNNLIDFFVCNKINARKKIGWVHFDVSKFGFSKVSEMSYRFFHKICVVSDEAKMNFNKMYPQFKDKTITFHNRIPVDDILIKANEKNVYTHDKSINILTVGRIAPEKGQSLSIKSLKQLIDLGYNINWYFVGDGPHRSHCENLAKELGVYNHTFFEGNQINPYVYMKNCDIYVQPSFHEGFCITLAEALCFPNPIVSTNFAGAKEQLKNRTNAIITEAKTESLVNAIIKAIKFPPIQNIAANLHTDNLNYLYQLLDE